MNKDLEKQRRFMGKEMSKTREQMEVSTRFRLGLSSGQVQAEFEFGSGWTRV